MSKPDNFSAKIATGAIAVLGVAAGFVYFIYTGSPDMMYQFAQ